MQGSRLDGLQLLDVFQTQHPDMPVVMISGHGNVETAVSAIRRGAYDYIEKPFKIDRLLLITQRAMEATRLKIRGRGAARPRQQPVRRHGRRLAGAAAGEGRHREIGADQFAHLHLRPVGQRARASRRG